MFSPRKNRKNKFFFQNLKSSIGSGYIVFKSLNLLLEPNIRFLLVEDPNLTDHGLRVRLLDIESIKSSQFGLVFDPLDSPTYKKFRMIESSN